MGAEIVEESLEPTTSEDSAESVPENKILKEMESEQNAVIEEVQNTPRKTPQKKKSPAKKRKSNTPKSVKKKTPTPKKSKLKNAKKKVASKKKKSNRVVKRRT